MKNKKLIVIINKFPKILYMIIRELREEDVDYILDSSNYSLPVPLLRITNPDKLLLNLKLPARRAIELLGQDMQDTMQIKRGMITTNPGAYYMSLCTTLNSDYIIDKYMDIELVPDVVAKQQLN